MRAIALATLLRNLRVNMRRMRLLGYLPQVDQLVSYPLFLGVGFSSVVLALKNW